MKKKDSMVGAAYSDLINTKQKLTYTVFLQALGLIVILFLYATKDQVVVVVPNTVQEELVIGEGTANAAYQKRYADYVATKIGNVNPKNIDYVTESINDMLSPSLRSQLLPALEREAVLLKARELSQDFIVNDVIWSGKNDMAYVWGEKVTRQKNGQERDSETYTYEVRVKPFDGRPRVLHVRGYKGSPKNNPDRMLEENVPVTPFYEGEVATVNDEGENQ